jgi:hypothetical protein
MVPNCRSGTGRKTDTWRRLPAAVGLILELAEGESR